MGAGMTRWVRDGEMGGGNDEMGAGWRDGCGDDGGENE